jgi:hypothetical protein
MKEFIAAVIAVIAIGIVSSLVLEGYQRSSDNAYAGSGARIDPPGFKPKG